MGCMCVPEGLRQGHQKSMPWLDNIAAQQDIVSKLKKEN